MLLGTLPVADVLIESPASTAIHLPMATQKYVAGKDKLLRNLELEKITLL